MNKKHPAFVAAVAFIFVSIIGAIPFGVATQAQASEQDRRELETTVNSESEIVATENVVYNQIVVLDQEPLNPIQTENFDESIAKDTWNSNGKVVIIGDSRTVGMEQYLEDDMTVIAKVGQGYKWMINEAIPQVEEELEPGSTLLFNLGVNDLGDINQYIAFLTGFQTTHPDIRIVCLTVGPVNETTVTNEDINAFNSHLMASGFEVIDINAYLQEEGFQTVDGLHYTSATSERIAQTIINAVI